jgi:hypothetical protein
MNCWEFNKCGRESGGASAAEKGVCPAYPNHGRICAVVAGTLCEGKVQGMYALKIATCMKCDYYNSLHYDKALHFRTMRRKDSDLQAEI